MNTETKIHSPLLRKAIEQKESIKQLTEHTLYLSIMIAKLQIKLGLKEIELEESQQSETIMTMLIDDLEDKLCSH